MPTLYRDKCQDNFRFDSGCKNCCCNFGISFFLILLQMVRHLVYVHLNPPQTWNINSNLVLFSFWSSKKDLSKCNAFNYGLLLCFNQHLKIWKCKTHFWTSTLACLINVYACLIHRYVQSNHARLLVSWEYCTKKISW